MRALFFKGGMTLVIIVILAFVVIAYKGSISDILYPITHNGQPAPKDHKIAVCDASLKNDWFSEPKIENIVCSVSQPITEGNCPSTSFKTLFFENNVKLAAYIGQRTIGSDTFQIGEGDKATKRLEYCALVSDSKITFRLTDPTRGGLELDVKEANI